MFARVGELLQLFGQVDWALRPRTFCILRVLGCQELMDSFVALKMTDASLPYSAGNLPNAIKGERRSRFLKLQKFVLSNPDLAHLEKDGGSHLSFPVVADGYFSSIQPLGEGGTSMVDHVFGPMTLKHFARKRIHRGKSALADQRALNVFLNELEILKKASHRHLVKLVSSYTDPTYVAIIMRPVADGHLRNYLQQPLSRHSDRNARQQCIRTFFGCLTKALEYLHSNNIQHKDIKPHNILVKGNEVYLTDFGTAKAHGESSRSNSTGPVRAFTPKYVAPEIYVYDPHGKPSDIWSMGCVFLEMVTILHDRTLENMERFYLEHGTKYGPYHLNQLATAAWIDELCQTSTASDLEPLTWIQEMLEAQPASRPTVSQVLASISDA
ncbi:kinase-like domain-containing protein, partial [Boeremia exigua]|uniref:kinase-like domain-containing protein n=1 Tax=Boeremia exigua TaxID=749465 RepID=UPI001E8E1827